MKLRGDRCRCSGCGEFFNSTHAFDWHRIGRGLDRRCLSQDEMRFRGGDKNTAGFWVTAIQAQAIDRGPVGEWRVDIETAESQVQP